MPRWKAWLCRLGMPGKHDAWRSSPAAGRCRARPRRCVPPSIVMPHVACQPSGSSACVREDVATRSSAILPTAMRLAQRASICIYIIRPIGTGSIDGRSSDSIGRRERALAQCPACDAWRRAIAGLGIVEHGAVAVARRPDRLCRAGSRAARGCRAAAPTIVDCEGRWITPGLIDCHTHLVHAGNRAHEFEMRLAGATYEEIARAGGGIVSSVAGDARGERGRAGRAVAAAARRADRRGRHHRRDQVRLRARPRQRAEVAARRAAARPRERPVTVRTSFLGAHALPPEANGDKDAYHRRWSSNEMLPAIAAEGLADAVDGFCEGIAFSPDADRARVRRGAGARPAGQAACRPALQPQRRRARRPLSARCRPIISNIPTRPASRRWRRPAPSRCSCPAPTISCARRKKPPVDLFRAARRADGGRHRLQSRHLAADLAAARP